MFTVFIEKKFESKITKIKEYIDKKLMMTPGWGDSEYEIEIEFYADLNYIENIGDQYFGTNLLNGINDICDDLDDRYTDE